MSKEVEYDKYVNALYKNSECIEVRRKLLELKDDLDSDLKKIDSSYQKAYASKSSTDADNIVEAKYYEKKKKYKKTLEIEIKILKENKAKLAADIVIVEAKTKSLSAQVTSAKTAWEKEK